MVRLIKIAHTTMLLKLIFHVKSRNYLQIVVTKFGKRLTATAATIAAA